MKEKDMSISLVRLIAFISIVTCHILQSLGNELAWWFNVGVQMFLCISGFLYGNRPVKESHSASELSIFVKQRFHRILIPYWITILLFSILEFIIVPPPKFIVKVLGAVLCYTHLPGGEHLWYIPLMLMCYLITPFLESGFAKNKWTVKSFLITAFFQILMFGIIFGLFIRYFNVAWIICYILGYLLGVNQRNKVLNENVVLLLFGILNINNLIQIYIDYISKIEFTDFYEKIYKIYCNFNHVSLGIFLFLIIKVIFKNRKFSPSFIKILDFSDKYSYECYLTHQFFILNSMSLMNITPILAINILLILILTFFTAWVVKKMSIYLQKNIIRS